MHTHEIRLPGILALLGAFATTILGSPAFTADAPSANKKGSWETLATKFPMPMVEAYSVEVGGIMYVLGGLDTKDPQAVTPKGAVLSYDPKSRQWTQKKQMPVATHHFGVTVYNDKIYLFGGFTAPSSGPGGWLPVTTTWEYSPKDDTWRQLAPISLARGAGAGLTWQNKMYYVGGAARAPGSKDEVLRYNGETDRSVPVLEEYDPAANTWKTLAPMSTGRNHFAAAAVDGHLYVFGGRLGSTFVVRSTNTELVEEYDIAADKWATKTSMPAPRSGTSANVYKGLIYVGGGEYQNQQYAAAFRAFEAYDPKIDRWTTLPRMPHPRHGFLGTIIGNELHYVGGDIQTDMIGYLIPVIDHDVYHFPD